MNTTITLPTWAASKAIELGLPEPVFSSALQMILQNKNLVNAMDHSAEMDDHIYQAVIRQATEARKQKAEAQILLGDTTLQEEAAHDLAVLSREELITDPFYRAVLPLLVKVVHPDPIRRLHAEEASSLIMQLADVKRKYRSTSITEVIVKQCREKLQA